MPDVGVLQLTIHDNSEQAAGGLDSLSRKLANVKRNASGFDLSGVSGQIKNLVDSIKASDTTIQRLGTLFNAVANYKKLNGIKFDAKPFKELKGAIGDGLKFGTAGTQINQIRQAIAGDWGSGDAKDKAIETIKAIAAAGESFASNGTAKAIKDVAVAIREYASAQKELAEVGGKLDVSKTIGEVVGANATPGKVMKLNLQQFGGGGLTDGLVTVTDTVQKASTEVDSFKAKVSALMDYLNHPSATNYNGFKEVANIATDAAGKNKDLIDSNKMLINEMNSVFNVPAMEKDGPFKYASDEVVHYRTMLANAKNDMEFWSREYDRIQKRIKYNGKTEERTNALGWAEKSFYTSAEKMEEYEAHLVKIEEYVNNVVSAQRDMFNASGAPSDQLQTFGSMEEMANRLGLSIDEVKRKLQDTYNSVYGNQGTPVYTTIEEAAQSLGISVENVKHQLQETYDKVYGTSAGTPEMFERMNEEANRTGGVIDLLRQKVAILQNEVSSGRTEKGTILSEKAIINAKIQIENLTQKIEKLESAKKNARGYGESLVESLVGDYSKIDLLTMKLASMKQALADDINANKLNREQIADRTMRIQDLVGRIEDLKNAQDSATKTTHGMSSVFGNLKERVSKVFPSLNGLLSRFKQIAKYRLLRGVLKHITEGFSEGVQNVYQYSKAIGSSFAPSMDSAASAILQMKNSIGAAVAPAIQSLIPILQTVVSWFITAVNYVNQFLSLLRGQQTWTRALPATSNAFGKQEKAARGAASAMKDLLADWDELNIIQSNTSGAGSGAGTSTAEDYLKMFEEVGSYDSKIKNLVEVINNGFGDILGLAKEIGVAVLGWKASAAFSGLIGAIGGLVAGGALIDMTFKVAQELDRQYMKTGETGWLVADQLQTLLGGVLAGKVLKKVLGGEIAKVAIPITFAVGAIASIKALVGEKDVSALSEKGILMELNSALKGGVATGAALYSLGRYTAGASIGGGIGGALFTFGLAVGIKAIAEAADTKEITRDTIKANLLSAGSIGAGLAIAEAVLGGTIGTIVLAGGGGAILTLGALFAIEAIVASGPKRIAWGDKKITHDEIQAFVDKEMFSFDLPAHLDLRAEAVTMKDSSRESLNEKVRELIPIVDSIVAGINDEESLKNIDQIVNGEDGLIERFNKSQEASENRIKLAMSVVPPVNEEGESVADKYSKIFGEGYTMMEGVMKNLGKQLSDALRDSYDESLTENAREMAKQTSLEVTKAMMQISAISTQSKVEIDVRNKFSKGLKDLDQSGMQGILDYYKDQVAGAEEFINGEYQAQIDDAEAKWKSFEGYAALALENGGMLGGVSYQDYIDMAKQYEDAYNYLIDARQRSIDKALSFYKTGKGYDMVREAMLEYTKNNKPNFARGAAGMQYLIEEVDDDNAVWMEGIDVADNIKTALYSAILGGFAEQDQSTVAAALRSGILKLTDFIDREMTEQWAQQLGLKGESKELWDQYVSELIPEDTTLPEAIIEAPIMIDPVLKTPMEDYGIDVETEEANITGKRFNPNNLRASAGYSDANFGPYVGTAGVATDDATLTASVKKGTEDANVQLVTALNGLLAAVNAISRKDFTVKVTPSTVLGIVGRTSASMLSNVTGVDVP